MACVNVVVLINKIMGLTIRQSSMALYDIYYIFEGFELEIRGNHIACNEFCPVLEEAPGQENSSVLQCCQ
jgi:hypothetical protein